MLRQIRARMTYANVAATLALIFAMTGSAVAATHYLITSSKQINPKVLKELKTPGKTGPAGTPGAPGPTGAAGAEGLPGKGEPGEKGERGEKGEKGEKGEAGGPRGERGEQGVKGETGPGGPEGAEGERGPEGPEGGSAAALKRWRKTVKAPGKTKTTPEVVVLATIGPFKITGHCYENLGETVADTYIGTTEAGSVAAEPEEGEQIALSTLEEVSITPEPAESETAEHEAVFKGPNGGLFSAETKTGSVALDGAANEGVYLKGSKEPACYFSGYVVDES